MLPPQITKPSNISLTPTEVDALNQGAKENQPENLKLNLSADDENTKKIINKVYQEFCDAGICFSLTCILPDSNQPMTVYRIGELTEENQTQYREKQHLLLGGMYGFLDYCKFIDILEQFKWIKILRRKFHVEHS
jgi:hypothetical protein